MTRNQTRRTGDQHDMTSVAHRTGRGRVALASLAATALLGLVAVGCGGDDDAASDVELSAAGARGREVSSSNGCAACHGSNGQGGAGPTWIGLYGAEVELADGSFVTADDDYLRTAIAEPNADLRAGYSLRMPENDLTDDEIADVIAYIRDLSADTGGDG